MLGQGIKLNREIPSKIFIATPASEFFVI